MYKSLKLSELFTFEKGSNEFNKKTINENSGNIPVYSGQTENNGIIGYSSKSTYSGRYIRIITVGEAGKCNIIEGEFSLAQNNGILKPIDDKNMENISLEYIMYLLNKKLPPLSRGEGKQKSLLKQHILDVYIDIPILDNNQFDLKTQKQIAIKFQKIDEKFKKLITDKISLQNITIDLEKYNNCVFKKVSDIFDLSVSTNNSKFTKSFIKKFPGDIPVYGATKLPNEVGYGYIKDNVEMIEIKNGKRIVTKIKYFENCLTYNIDGTAGYIFYRKGRFSLSEKVRPLIIKEELKEVLNPEYLKYIMQPIFRKNIRGRKGPNGENEFTKIGKTIIEDLLIPIPVDNNQKFSYEKQTEIANQYKKLERIRDIIISKIDDIINVQFDL